VWIEYPSGLATKPGCGEESLTIAVPKGTQLPVRPGCEPSLFESLGEKARKWWEGVSR
jgi:hypothetical protein